MPHGDDMTGTHEYRGFTVGDNLILKPGSQRDHEQLIAVDIDLRMLVGFQSILNRKRVKALVLLELPKLLLGRLQ